MYSQTTYAAALLASYQSGETERILKYLVASFPTGQLKDLPKPITTGQGWLFAVSSTKMVISKQEPWRREKE